MKFLWILSPVFWLEFLVRELGKLHYIHNNQMHERWNLCTRLEDYRFSSAGFYEKWWCDFSFLQDIRAEF